MSDELKLKIIQELSKGNVRIGQLIMEVQGDNHYHEKEDMTQKQEAQAPQAPTQGSISSEQMVIALKQCSAYIWGNSAYSIAFCVCRDALNMGYNASQYERVLGEQGIMLPAGTINTAMNRNQWMKYPIDSWEENGASGRALKLRNAFMNQVKMLMKNSREGNIGEGECQKER